jgi:excisionase family DNA binding protein
MQRESLPMLLPVPYAARLLGISRSAAYRLVMSGDLPSQRLGGRVYIVTAKLFEMLEAA